MSSSIILPHGSPFSPKGVMDMIAFGEPPSPIKIPNITSPSTISGRGGGKDEVMIGGTTSEEEDSKNATATLHDYGSSAYHARFVVKPSEDIVRPIMHTLFATGRDPRIAWKVLMDDLLVHGIGLKKCGTNGDIFCGIMHSRGGERGGQRVVIVRSNYDELFLACPDATVAAELLLLFKSQGVQIHEI